jgi:hypothetical protein
MTPFERPSFLVKLRFLKIDKLRRQSPQKARLAGTIPRKSTSLICSLAPPSRVTCKVLPFAETNRDFPRLAMERRDWKLLVPV